MRCLCCGKIIRETASVEEQTNGWHKRCVKIFFGTNHMPVLDLSDKQMEELADSMVAQGLTVPGVQKKLSLHLSQEQTARLTIVDYPTGYILKPQTEEYAFLPEFEELSMKMAEIAGIRVVPHALIKMKNEYAYITKRVDRRMNNEQMVMLAMEDFCQLTNRLTQDKYKGSYEACGRVINRYSIHQGLDMTEMFFRVLFSFATGNSDMHLKNFSLIETEPGSRLYILSEAYDILPVNIILPEDSEQMALTVNGKKRNIRKKDFLELANHCDIPKNAAMKMIKKICNMEDAFIECCMQSYLPVALQKKTQELIHSRIEILT